MTNLNFSMTDLNYVIQTAVPSEIPSTANTDVIASPHLMRCAV